MDPRTYERMRALQDRHWWFTARREILKAEIARLQLPGAARILEVGCGPGGNLELLKGFGSVTAIEPDDQSRRYAAERAGVPVMGGLLPDALPRFEEAFDLVAAFDVIEHVNDDAGAVRALGGLLKPGGFLIATAPAHPWMWSGHDESHHHKRRYRADEFQALFPAAGLTLRRCTFFNTLLFPPVAGLRALKALTGAKGGDDDALPPAPLNRLLHSVFAAEKALLAATDLPFGVSLMAIGRRA